MLMFTSSHSRYVAMLMFTSLHSRYVAMLMFTSLHSQYVAMLMFTSSHSRYVAIFDVYFLTQPVCVDLDVYFLTQPVCVDVDVSRCSVTCIAGQSSIGTNSGLPLLTQNFTGLCDWWVLQNYSTSTTASSGNSLTSLHQSDQSPFDDNGLRSGSTVNALNCVDYHECWSADSKRRNYLQISWHGWSKND